MKISQNKGILYVGLHTLLEEVGRRSALYMLRTGRWIMSCVSILWCAIYIS